MCNVSIADSLVITHKATELCKSGLLVDGTLEILRCAQDDKQEAQDDNPRVKDDKQEAQDDNPRVKDDKQEAQDDKRQDDKRQDDDSLSERSIVNLKGITRYPTGTMPMW